MRKLFLPLCLMLASFTVDAQQVINSDTKSYVEVTGYAQKEVEPDQIFVRVELNQADLKGKYTLNQWENRLKSALKNAGINIDKQLKLENAYSDFSEGGFLKRPDDITTKSYQVEVNSAQQLNRLFASLSKENVANANVIGYQYSKKEELQDQLMQEAMRNGANKAKLLAQAIDQSVGKAFYIYETPNNYYGRDMFMMSMARTNAANGEVSPFSNLQFKPIKQECSVKIRFDLE